MNFLWTFHGFLRMFYGFCVCDVVFFRFSMDFRWVLFACSMHFLSVFYGFHAIFQVFSGGFLGFCLDFLAVWHGFLWVFQFQAFWSPAIRFHRLKPLEIHFDFFG